MPVQTCLQLYVLYTLWGTQGHLCLHLWLQLNVISAYPIFTVCWVTYESPPPSPPWAADMKQSSNSNESFLSLTGSPPSRQSAGWRVKSLGCSCVFAKFLHGFFSFSPCYALNPDAASMECERWCKTATWMSTHTTHKYGKEEEQMKQRGRWQLTKWNQLNQMLLFYKHGDTGNWKLDPYLYVFRTHKPHRSVKFMRECVEPLVSRACMLFHCSVDILRSDTVHDHHWSRLGCFVYFCTAGFLNTFHLITKPRPCC